MRRLFAALAATVVLAVGHAVLGGPASAAPPPEEGKRALLVGVSQYQPPTRPTFGGAGDVGAVKQVLLKNGWSPDNIRTLVDGEATDAAVRSGLDWLVNGSGPDTFSYFHYSGHTRQEPRGHADGDPEEYDELLWLVNNQFIADGELGDRLRGLQGRSVISIAACEAAGFDDNISAPNRLMLTASKETEKAYEYSGSERSVFVEMLYDQALNNGAGDADRNRAVSLQEGFAHAAAGAPVETANQTPYGPQNPVMAGGDGSQWFLSPPPGHGALLGGLIPKGLLPAEVEGLVRGLVPQTP